MQPQGLASFREHIDISAFRLDTPFLSGTIAYKRKVSSYEMAFIEFEGFTCVYVLPSSEM